jgi:hypothetical protein
MAVAFDPTSEALVTSDVEDSFLKDIACAEVFDGVGMSARAGDETTSLSE